MAQLFAPRADVILRAAIVAAAALVIVIPGALWAWARGPAATGQYQVYRQPIPFAHPLHVNALKIDCRYCHAGAERTSMAGLPPTKACVPCHWESLVQSALFAPVRDSLATGRPIPWRRVTRVPDFVFFDHSAHARAAVACQTCHGPVDLMPEVYQAAPLTMEWCVDCHREPERHLATIAVGSSGWRRSDIEGGAELAARYDVRRLTSCTICHR
ncbi:MAG: cytochrome c3 family protein [Acidobacteria bacterium]|nr:cytochrome c3 family protein [Acidobacteriota bacterium]